MDDEELSTEDALLEATGEVLATHGIENLTTQRVADEWGKAQSLVHYYYDTKEDLVVAYIESLRERNQRGYESLDEEPPLDRLHAFLDVSDAFEEPDQGFNRVQFELHAAAAHNDRYREALNELEEDGRAFVRKIIEDGIQAGTFRDVDVEATVTLLLSAHDGGVLRVGPLERREDAESLERGLDTYLESVLLGSTTEMEDANRGDAT